MSHRPRFALRALVLAMSLMLPACASLPKPGDQAHVDLLPEVADRTAALYPEAARSNGIQGTVLLTALVDRHGRVVDVKVTKSIPELDAAAMDAVRRWRFKPAISWGRSVAAWVTLPVRFTLAE